MAHSLRLIPPDPAGAVHAVDVNRPSRIFEWMTSGMMLGIAVVVAVDPHAVNKGGFYLLGNLGITAPVLGVFFTFVGCMRGSALVANGVWPLWGPRARAFCALLGAMIWGEMAFALNGWSGETGYISIGVPVYLFLCIGELISCYRAASDVRSIVS